MTKPVNIRLPYPLRIDERVREFNPQNPTARYLDNVNVKAGALESRRGKKILLKTTSGNTLSNLIIHYDEDVLNNQVLYKVSNGGVYSLNVTDIGGSASDTQITTLTAGSTLSATRISTLGGNYTVIANGTSAPGIWDGSTFTAYTTSGGTYNITGTDAATVCSSSITSVTTYAGHIFFFNAGSTKFYSLALNSIAGAVTTVDMSMFVRARGLIGGGDFLAREGSDRSLAGFVAIGDNGQCAVFTGTDPDDLTTWKMEGVATLPGRPIGRRAWVSVDRDMYVLTTAGLCSVSKALLGDYSPISAPIQEQLLNCDLTSAELAFDSLHRRVIVNLNSAADSIAVTQYVLHLDDMAWTTWSGVQAASLSSQGSTTVCAVGDTLWRVDYDSLDETSTGVYADIVSRIEWSSGSFGTQSKKRWIRVAPQFRAYGTISINIGMISDFENQNRLSTAGSWTGENLSWAALEALTWGQWEVMPWAADEVSPLSWKALSGTGYSGALTMTTSTAMSPIKFISCSLILEVTSTAI
jgi:hypothetical protein